MKITQINGRDKLRTEVEFKISSCSQDDVYDFKEKIKAKVNFKLF